MEVGVYESAVVNRHECVSGGEGKADRIHIVVEVNGEEIKCKPIFVSSKTLDKGMVKRDLKKYGYECKGKVSEWLMDLLGNEDALKGGVLDVVVEETKYGMQAEPVYDKPKPPSKEKWLSHDRNDSTIPGDDAGNTDEGEIPF